MNTQAIRGNNDSWAQFVKLTQEARMRNQGISTQARTATQVTNTKMISKTTAAILQSQSVPFAKNVSFNSAVPRVQSKILGGMFDTYV